MLIVIYSLVALLLSRCLSWVLGLAIVLMFVVDLWFVWCLG